MEVAVFDFWAVLRREFVEKAARSRGPQPQAAPPPPTDAITKKAPSDAKSRPAFVPSCIIHQLSASSCADYVPYFLLMHRIAYTARKSRIL